MNRLVIFFTLLFTQTVQAASSGTLFLAGTIHSSAHYQVLSRTPQSIIMRNLSLPKDEKSQTIALYDQNQKIEMKLEKEQKKNFWQYKMLFNKAQSERSELRLVVTAN